MHTLQNVNWRLHFGRRRVPHRRLFRSLPKGTPKGSGFDGHWNQSHGAIRLPPPLGDHSLATTEGPAGRPARARGQRYADVLWRIERGRVEGERELVTRRFGPGTAEQFLPVLNELSDPDQSRPWPTQ